LLGLGDSRVELGHEMGREAVGEGEGAWAGVAERPRSGGAGRAKCGSRAEGCMVLGREHAGAKERGEWGEGLMWAVGRRSWAFSFSFYFLLSI
jgi:hypothetical protein